jgi:putative FmdB family regulatory protein
MPIYEYKCRRCGAVTEVLATSSRRPDDVVCRVCGGRHLEKTPSVPAVLSASRPRSSGQTCCGRSERCQTPPCSTGDKCRRD